MEKPDAKTTTLFERVVKKFLNTKPEPRAPKAVAKKAKKKRRKS